MSRPSESTIAFFEAFDEANNSFDADRLSRHMSDPVVGAGPDGGVQAIGLTDFMHGIGERKQYLDNLGFMFVKTEPIEEIRLNDRYILVKTHGIMRLKRLEDEPVDLVHDSVYILFAQESGPPRMVFTLSHEDPMKMAQDLGLFLDSSTPYFGAGE